MQSRPTADDGGDWRPALPDGHPAVGFRVHQIAVSEAATTIEHETYAFVIRRSKDGEDLETLSIETWTTEESRAASINPQLLAEHQSCTETQALAVAEAVGLTGDYRKALAIAARLHDEGKRATRWQRAFNARDGKIYAKTKGPISSSLLDGYRHEFGSLPYAEKDAGFRDLPPDLQALVLHIIAAHHGRARPLIETTGCEDAPSALEGRTRDVALRFCMAPEVLGVPGAWPGGSRCCAPRTSRRRETMICTSPQKRWGPLMAEASIPVDLFNPGQVFACLGFLEAADVLLGDASGGFDWSDVNVKFRLRAAGEENPVAAVMAFLATTEVRWLSPDLEIKERDGGITVVQGGISSSDDPKSPDLPGFWSDNIETHNTRFILVFGLTVLRDSVRPLKNRQTVRPHTFGSRMRLRVSVNWIEIGLCRTPSSKSEDRLSISPGSTGKR